MLYVNPVANATFRSAALSPGAAAREDQALKEFERIFLFQMLKEMRRTIPDGALFGASSQKDWFDEMMDDYLAGEMAESGQLGVADQMKGQIHQQDVAISAPVGIGIALPDRGTAASAHASAPDRNGLPVAPESPGIAIDRASVVGIATTRALDGYRLNQ